MAHGSDYQKQKFYFLKLPKDWLKNARVKKLRQLAGGDTYTIIYLKLLLMSINHDCKIIYEGIEPSLAEELALKIDEKEENVKVTINYFKGCGMLVEQENGDLLCEEALRMVGSLTYNAVYKKEKRDAARIAIEGPSVPVGQIPTTVPPVSGHIDIEKDKEEEIDKELDKELDSDLEKDIDESDGMKENSFALALAAKLTHSGYVIVDTKEFHLVASMLTRLIEEEKIDPLKLSSKITDFNDEIEDKNLSEIKDKVDYLEQYLKGNDDDDLPF